MISKPDDLPSDLASALAALQAEREARLRAEAVADYGATIWVRGRDNLDENLVSRRD
jgi:hypothetical protein